MAAELELLGQLADQMNVHVLRRRAGIEMHVDIDAELARQLEHAADLSGMVGVVIRGGADHPDAALQRLDHQFVGARIVGQALLRHHADFEIDGPAVLVDQLLHALETAQADAGVHLDMGAHPRRAVRDRVFEGTAGALMHVLDRDSMLDRGDPRHRLGIAPLFRRAAVDDPRLVEMDMGLDESGADQPSGGVVGLALGRQIGSDCRDPAVLDPDIDEARRGGAGDSGVAQDQIHGFILLWHAAPRPTLPASSVARP